MTEARDEVFTRKEGAQHNTWVTRDEVEQGIVDYSAFEDPNEEATLYNEALELNEVYNMMDDALENELAEKAYVKNERRNRRIGSVVIQQDSPTHRIRVRSR